MKIVFALSLFFLFSAAGITLSQDHSFVDDSWMLYNDSDVAVINITMDPAKLLWMYNHVLSDSLHLATVHFKNAFIDETIDSVGIRLRGNTSRHSQKKSFKLSFNTYVQGREFYGVEKLNLNGEHNDPSIIRSKLCWDHFSDIDMNASRAAHTAVYINDMYFGLYISVEHIDEEFLNKNYVDDSGNLWRCLYPADLTYLGSDPNLYKFFAGSRRTYDLKTNIEDDDYFQLARLIDIINNTPSDVFADSLETILNVPEVIKYFAIDALVASWDDYRFLKNNYYLYYEPREDMFRLIPYDYDNTFGIWWEGIFPGVDWTNRDIYDWGPGGEARPLADRIIDNLQYRNLYSHFVQFYKLNVFELPIWEQRIDDIKQMITPWAEIDSFRTLDYGFTMDDFHNSYSAFSYYNQHVKRGLKEYIILRNQSLNGQIHFETDAAPVIYELNYTPKYPSADDTVYVYSSIFSANQIHEVKINYYPQNSSTAEEYEMFFQPVPGTKIVEEADRWIGSIPPIGEDGYGKFEIIADDIFGHSQNYPRSGAINIRIAGSFNSEVLINEFLALNDSTNMDEFGEYDDWLELYNPSSNDIILSGMYLTDDPDSLTRWSFPFGGVIIGAGQYLLVWCDNDPEQGPLHTNFRLSGDGEFIALVAEDGVSIIDSLSYGAQSSDISFGRYPDGTDNWDFLTPTPGTSNILTGIDDETIPLDFKISVYPNPFNATTAIEYQIPVRTNVTIKIYDLLGGEIWNKIEGEKLPGTHSLHWNSVNNFGSQVSTGIYLCRIKTNDFSKTIKLVLLK